MDNGKSSSANSLWYCFCRRWPFCKKKQSKRVLTTMLMKMQMSKEKIFMLLVFIQQRVGPKILLWGIGSRKRMMIMNQLLRISLHIQFCKEVLWKPYTLDKVGAGAKSISIRLWLLQKKDPSFQGELSMCEKKQTIRFAWKFPLPIHFLSVAWRKHWMSLLRQEKNSNVESFAIHWDLVMVCHLYWVNCCQFWFPKR